MKRKNLIPHFTEPEGMSAMSDVVFLLLIFFIVTMSTYVELTFLDIKIPTSAKKKDFSELDKVVKIEITADGQYIANGIPMDHTSLLSLLKRYARLMPDADFLIRCHPESEHKNLVLFLSDASLFNLKNLKLVE